MKKTKNNCFYKRKTCPATNLLLSYSNCEVATTVAARVARHLGECEFCAAEAQFLRTHRPSEETFKLPEMPFQLRQLAEILLGGKQAEFVVLRQLFGASRIALRDNVSLSV